jgi:hypothetical protein
MGKRKRTIQNKYGNVEGYEIEEDDSLSNIIPNGGAVRVRMDMMDSLDPLQRAVAEAARRHELLVSDGTDDPLALNRPGFRYSTNTAERTAADSALDQAYQEVEERDANAWREGG